MNAERFECNVTERGYGHRAIEALMKTEDGIQTRDYTWALRADHGLVRRKSTVDFSHLKGLEIGYTIDALARRPDRHPPKPGSRYITQTSECKDWFCRQLTLHAGVVATSLKIGPVLGPFVQSANRSFLKPGARYSGTALVVNPKLLADAYNNGIGDGKAYGFGMLLIKEN